MLMFLIDRLLRYQISTGAERDYYHIGVVWTRFCINRNHSSFLGKIMSNIIYTFINTFWHKMIAYSHYFTNDKSQSVQLLLRFIVFS